MTPFFYPGGMKWHLFVGFSLAAMPLLAQPDGRFHPLLPGIEATPLSLDLPNCNNLLYRHDGKLVALSYPGDLYLLTDTDGDGAEDHAELFWESNGEYMGQIGMDLAPKGSPHGNAVFLAVKGKIIMVADQDGDDRAEVVRTLAEGWPPARAGVDVTGLAVDPRDGSVWHGLGVRLYNDAYEIEETGTAQNDLASVRGAIHRIAPDFQSSEKICTGIRWPIALRFNRHGDLFCTDQEGATWLPNGNPYDELLHVQHGRHYGFPPRHPLHLPNVIDEPSIFDYGPQHQSTCGMHFNEPVNGGSVFGPSWWRGDAFIVGQSRGKLYRTKLVKTDAGYVAHNELLACFGFLGIDVCGSPSGELRMCAHSGPPDWGTGPKGKGKIWRITYQEAAPQPVLAWRERPNEVRIAYDRRLPENWKPSELRVEAGAYVRAGDRFETMRPGYEVVKRQLAAPRMTLEVEGTQTLANRQMVALETNPLKEATWLGMEIEGKQFLQADTSGIEVQWQGEERGSWAGWLPHADLSVSRELTAPSARHRILWEQCQSRGTLRLKTKLDLWQMLHPAIQQGSQLDYEYAPETVSVTFVSSTGPFRIKTAAAEKASTSGQTAHDATLTFTPKTNQPIELELELSHLGEGLPDFTAFWSTERDPRHRAFPRRRFLMPWATVSPNTSETLAARPEIRGGDWAKGKRLFFGPKTQCSACHQWQGQGIHIGPDLTNLAHRDHASVLRDIREPSATINPDYPTHEVTLVSGATFPAVQQKQADGHVKLGVGPGAILPVKATDIVTAKPFADSLMPKGLDQNLTKKELRDLMTFLLVEAPVMRDYPSLPRDGVDQAPAPRTRAELDAVLAGAPDPPAPIKPIEIVLVAGAKDHGHGEHDYPRWQHVWSRLLNLASEVTVSTAWEWPTAEQWENADVLIFYKRGDWAAPQIGQLDKFLKRGGGAVFIHWACEAGADAGQLANYIGLASDRSQTRYRHGLLDVTFKASSNPILRGFDKTRFHDESYWALVGNPAPLNILATCQEEGKERPLFWTLEYAPPPTPNSGRGTSRVFVSIPGHYSWTFDDPFYRVLLLRGIAWTAREPIDRFNHLIEAGLEVRDE